MSQRTPREILEAGTDAADHLPGRGELLHRRFLETAKRRWFSFAMADSSGRELTYGKALAGSLALASKIRGQCRGDRMVGLMLPASVGGVLANIATLMAGKVPVNLNFTAGAEAIAAAVDQCGIRTIITSKVFLAKAKLATPEGAWFLEDVMKTISPVLRLGMLVAGLLLPARMIEWLFIRGERDPDGLATVIFSSGSTGVPKGVMLSHRNIVANAEAMAQVFRDDRRGSHDRRAPVLPLLRLHGLALAAAALRLRHGVSSQPDGRRDDRRAGPEASGHAAHRDADLLPRLLAPLLCPRRSRACDTRSSAPRSCESRSREPSETSTAWNCWRATAARRCRRSFRSMCPIARRSAARAARRGTVGHPLPGVATRVVDLETRTARRRRARTDCSWSRVPIVMLGYLGNPALTRGGPSRRLVRDR